MGCFQSIQKKSVVKRLEGKPIVDASSSSDKDAPVHEFYEVQNEPIEYSEAVPGINTSPDEKFFDPEIMSDFHSDPQSPNNELLSSAIVELPESMEDASSEGSRRPDSPDFVVSPNPGSPSRMSPPMPGPTAKEAQAAPRAESDSTSKPEEFKSATATPVQAHVVPAQVSARTAPLSRILQVAEAKNSIMMLHVFGIWRFESMSSKIGTFRVKLDAAGKASEVILKDNAALKARVAELEHAIAVVQAVPLKSQATTTEDLQGYVSVPTTPVVKSQLVSGFATPMSNPGSVPPSVPEYATPEPVRPPPATLKLSWEDYLRPSLKEQAPPVSLNVHAPVMTKGPDKKEKLRAISEDLSRLSDSLSAVELKHRRPLTQNQ